MLLNAENYSSGFLIDEELMAGVTQHPQDPSQFVAFILRHTTGEYLGYQPFPSVAQALEAIHQVQRPWTFEAVGGCGSCGGGSCGQGNCSKGGGCGGCKKVVSPLRLDSGG